MAKKKAAPTKSEVVAQICEDAELSRKQVAALFESLNGIIKKKPSVATVCSRCWPAEDESRQEARHEGASGSSSPRKR